MVQLQPSPDSPLHFLLQLPPGIAANDPELFGFYTYELRIGHLGPVGDSRWWSTANGRFGSPLRVAGIQHPAPPLTCYTGRYELGTGNQQSIINQIRGIGATSGISFPLDAPALRAMQPGPTGSTSTISAAVTKPIVANAVPEIAHIQPVPASAQVQAANSLIDIHELGTVGTTCGR